MLATDEREAGVETSLLLKKKKSKKFFKVFKLANFELKPRRISYSWYEINSLDGRIEFGRKLVDMSCSNMSKDPFKV